MRRNSSIIESYQRLKGDVENKAAAEKSRKTSKLENGQKYTPRPEKRPDVVPAEDNKEARNIKADQSANSIQKMDEHRIPLEELCFRFGTSVERGLTTEAALKRNLE